LVDAELGARVTGFVSFIDFGPTLLHLAGVEVPDAVDGRPFLGVGISRAEVDERDEAFGYADRFDEKYDLVRTLRKGNFEYVRSYQPFNFDGLQNNYRYKMLAYTEWRDLFREGKLNAVQRQFFERRDAEALYNLKDDPYETQNLARDPRYASTTADLRRRLTAQVKRLPDLSFYPESYLVEEAFNDPVAFGQDHKNDIARLVDIADLSLAPFADVRAQIERGLNADDSWQRYWALIACSSHGKAAKSLIGKATELAAQDPELLVRVRAAEFLGLISAADPRPTILDCLARTTSPTEANLILNTLVLLRDGDPGYEFAITRDHMKGLGTDNTGYVERRMEYLGSSNR
jgi:hypothetical protein